MAPSKAGETGPNRGGEKAARAINKGNPAATGRIVNGSGTMTAANANTAPAARTSTASERDALLRVMAFLPALPRPTAKGRAVLDLFR